MAPRAMERQAGRPARGVEAAAILDRIVKVIERDVQINRCISAGKSEGCIAKGSVRRSFGFIS